MKLGGIAAALVLALAAFAGDVDTTRAELCVVVDPVLELGCRAGQAPASAPSSAAPSAPEVSASARCTGRRR
jgi:hypothetical protein